MKKKILSLILCSTLAFSGAITANAEQTTHKTQYSKFVDLKTQQYVDDNSLLVSGYNIEPDHTGTVIYRNSTKNLKTVLDFKNCSHTPQLVNFTKTDGYFIGITADKAPSVYGIINVSNYESGIYKKVRIKLSDFSEHFTEDGKYIYKNETFDFNKKNNVDGTSYYDSLLVIKSGAAHTAVIPDKNGEVEFYISVNPLHKTQTFCNIANSLTVLGADKINIQFGDTDNSGYTDVKDVTQIQLALTGEITLDDYGKFNADINLDGIYDVKDVTELQIALTKKTN